MEYSYTINNNISYQLIDVGGLWSNWTFNSNPDCDCILYIAALNQYAHGRTDWNNSLMKSLNDIKDVKQNYADPTDAKMIIFLNKCDLFKDSLYHKSLNNLYFFEKEYKGRNYDDYGDKLCARIMQRICLELVMSGDVNIQILNDVAGIMLKYCHLRIDFWLELVYDDGIEFIKEKMLNIGPNVENVFVTNATDIDQMKNVMDEIHCKLHVT